MEIKAALVPVKSSAIHSAGYSPGILYVRFNNGKAHRFLKVPEPVYRAMIAAPSIGRFFGANVRGKFKDERV